MTTPRHTSIRRFLPAGISLVLNGALCLALLRLAVSTTTPETEIAVELQAPVQEMTTALPPPPPRIMRLKQQAEEIIERERTEPEKARPSIANLFTPPEAPVTEQPPSEITQPENPAAIVETPPVPPAAAGETPGTGNPTPANNDMPGGNPGGAPQSTGPGTGTGTSPGTGITLGGAPAAPGGTGPGATPGGGSPGNATGPVTTGNTGGTNNPPGDGQAGVTPPGAGNTPPAPPPPKGISRKGYAKTAPQPAYPPEARDDGIQGAVRLRLAIDETGRIVGDPHIVKSSGNRLLDKAALRGVKKWVFEPELEDGKPVASTLVVEVQFTLK